MDGCGHLLCELIGDACSIATNRSRGCTPNIVSRTTPPEVLDELRALLGKVDGDRTAAVRLAEIIRREALNDRPVLAWARIEEPELAPAIERLVVRRR
ncbi:MAG TPA: hypothetical protein VGM39_11200 [Kofleriaceae bacterium]